MSIRIALDNPPEFYTNLDFVQGRVILGLNRPETVGNIVVKLEGESRTALSPPAGDGQQGSYTGMDVVTESHKLLYLVQQIYPDNSMSNTAVGGMPGVLYPGQHEFRFKFKVPLNNICGDSKAMAALNGVGGVGGPGNAGLFGAFRTMDGSKQLMLRHVKSTLPPSLTGFPQEAEIRYYIKVTVQRPGLFKENWRYQIGFKFLPVESPRPPKTSQEAFARRPFSFKPRTPVPPKSRNPFFTSLTHAPANDVEEVPPVVEMSARLPHPSILTCNGALPLRIVATKKTPSQEQVYLTSLEIALVGYTNVRAHDLQNVEVTRWILCSATSLSIAIGSPSDPVETETVLPDDLWSNYRLPNTVAPSFTACNLSRRYEVELKLSVSWGLPSVRGKLPYPQTIYLPLKLSKVEIFSGITPPQQLLRSSTYRPQQQPPLPPRRPQNGPPQQPQSDPLYPPQLGPSNMPNYDDAPPSYDEAMAQDVTAPAERPAYSGVTAENAPSTMPPEKSGPH